MGTDATDDGQPTVIPRMSAPVGEGVPPAGASLYAPPPGYPPAPGYPGYPPVPGYGYPQPYPGYAIVPPVPGQSGGAQGGAPYGGPKRPGVGPWPQGIGDVLGTTFRLFFYNFWRLALLGVAVALLPALLCSGVNMALAEAEGWDVTKGTLGQHPYTSGTTSGSVPHSPLVQWIQHPPSLTQILLATGIGLVALALYLVLAAWVTAALALGAREVVRGQPVRVGQAMRVGLSRMPRVLGPTVLAVLIKTALVVMVEAPLWLNTAARMGLVASGGTGFAAAAAVPEICLGLGIYIALLVGLAYIWVRVDLAPYAAACDGLSPGNAIGWSWSLTSRNWWRIFIPVAVVGIVVQLVSWTAISVDFFSLIAHYLVVEPVLVALSQPLRASLRVVIYYDLRLRRQGFPALASELGLPGFWAVPVGPAASAAPGDRSQALP